MFKSYINITTIKRKKNDYIHFTLDSLNKSDWDNGQINLIMGSPDESYVERYRSDPRINIVSWDNKFNEIDGIRKLHNHNSVRSLTEGSDTDCYVFEDDVEFATNWFTHTKEAIQELDSLWHARDFVVALYNPYDYANLEQCPANQIKKVGKLTIPYNGAEFYGLQGMFYSKIFKKPIADYYKENCESQRQPVDILLGEWFVQQHHNFGLYAMRNSVIQHWGKSSTGLGDFHQTNNFLNQQT